MWYFLDALYTELFKPLKATENVDYSSRWIRDLGYRTQIF